MKTSVQKVNILIKRRLKKQTKNRMLKNDVVLGNGYYVKNGTECKEYYFCAFVGTKFERIYNYKCDSDLKFNILTRKCEYTTCSSL